MKLVGRTRSSSTVTARFAVAEAITLAIGFVGYWRRHGKQTMTGRRPSNRPLLGVIDSVMRRIDDERHMQRFTPRKPSSNWSKVNIAKVARLTEAGLMHPAGLAAFGARSEDRSGIYAFEQDEAAELPAEYEKRLRADAEAWAYWQASPPELPPNREHWVRGQEEETRDAPRAVTRTTRQGATHRPSLLGEART